MALVLVGSTGNLDSAEDISPIIPGLLLSSYPASQNPRTLKKYSVTHIVNATPDWPCRFPDRYTYLAVQDVDDAPTEDLARYFDPAQRFIHAAIEGGGTVLVHCNAGVSRSVSLVLAFLIARRDLSLKDALRLVRQQRPTVCPNVGFMQQLRAYEQSVRGSCSLSAVDVVVDNLMPKFYHAVPRDVIAQAVCDAECDRERAAALVHERIRQVATLS